MQIRFANARLRKLCEDEQVMLRKLGDRQARLLMRRLMEFRAAATLSPEFGGWGGVVGGDWWVDLGFCEVRGRSRSIL